MAASVAVQGLKEARAAFKAMPPMMQEEIGDATEQTARVVMADAKQRLRPGHGYRTGLLRQQIGMSFSRKTGIARVGIRKGVFVVTLPGGRKIRHRPNVIGHLVEFGHGGPHAAPAYPFMVPAAEAQRQPYAQRARRAMQVVAGRMAASPSGRGL